MKLNLKRDSYGKISLIAASILIWMLVLILLRTLGYHETWGIWKVPSWLPPFLDFRLIPGSAQSFAHGFEPSVENPYDPTERYFNYPAFWRLFFYTGITQADTVWISVTMIVLFFMSVFLFPEKLPIRGAIAMLLVLFSPASMLLYERGNVDLIVFVLCVLIVLTAGRSPLLTAILILFGAVMKMFPFFGITVLWKEPKNRFLLTLIVCTIVFGMYLAATWESVAGAWNLTMRGDGLSYGTNVFVTRYEEAISRFLTQWFTPHRTDLLLAYGPLAAGLGLGLLIAGAVRIYATEPPRTASNRNFAAFRMGASIYVGTFLLGNNFDYRLAFLILAIPQLMEWGRDANRLFRRLAWLTITLVYLSCWHLWIVEIPLEAVFGSAADSVKFWIILDEAFNWLLFIGLGYLLFASAPVWVKGLPGSLFSDKFSSAHQQS
jgi:hypothetical protein